LHTGWRSLGISECCAEAKILFFHSR